MSDIIPLKRCSRHNKCINPSGFLLPATSLFFSKRSVARDGLSPYCRLCENAKQREYRQNNPERVRARSRNRYQVNKEKNLAKKREYYKKKREEILIKRRKYVIDNPEIIRAYQRAHRLENTIRESRRNARKRELPNTFTPQEWCKCLEYWHYRCAVCGHQLRDLFGEVEPHADHWIPLIDPKCPGTVATNMICLCNHCNSQKSDTPAAVWIKRKFSKRKAKDVLMRIDTYFASITS